MRRRGARRIPFVLWATIWEHPRTLAHRLSWLPTRHLYRHADAVATYGAHVSRYVERHRGARGNVFVAPQAVDVDHFAAPVAPRGPRGRAGAGRRGPGSDAVPVRRPPGGREGHRRAAGRLARRRARRRPAGVRRRRAARGQDRKTGLDRPVTGVRCRLPASRPVRRRRCPGAALRGHRNFPGAVGIGCERGHAPADTRHSQRRRRRRSRGPGGPRPHRSGVPGRRRRRPRGAHPRFTTDAQSREDDGRSGPNRRSGAGSGGLGARHAVGPGRRPDGGGRVASLRCSQQGEGVVQSKYTHVTRRRTRPSSYL